MAIGDALVLTRFAVMDEQMDVMVIVAAGQGVRAGGSEPKQYQRIAGKRVLYWSVDAALAHPSLSAVIIVTSAEKLPEITADYDKRARVIVGGATRTQSVRAGLAEAARLGPVRRVLIHDAARPGLSERMIDRLLAALETHEGAAPFLPVDDALKRADAESCVEADVERAGLMRVQTPQAFRFEPLARAYAALAPDAALADDIAVLRGAGGRVHLVPGEAELMKITHPRDFEIAERLLAPVAMVPRVGSGFDAHRFCAGSFVTLCGVQIPHNAGLLGHSDADAGWHALTDAILGALAMGDIGDHFPPSDPKWKGASSDKFLKFAVDLVAARGGRLVHCDITLICERPRIKAHRAAMRQRTAEVTGLALDAISVKATTTEEMGFTGRQEGLAAQANATILLPP